MNRHGKTLFITGASRGIGLAIAKRAAHDGANIVIAAKTRRCSRQWPASAASTSWSTTPAPSA
jgi:citronellol/citronellal dehydrogenase